MLIRSLFREKQEMPSRQQKSPKNGLEGYLVFERFHILVTLRWDDGRSPGDKNVCRLFFSKELKLALQIITESVKTKKSCVSWKIFETEFKFLTFSSISSKALCLGQQKSIANVLRNRQCKKAFAKKMKKIYA